VQKAPDLGARMCELFFVCSGVLEALNHHGKYSYTLDETVSIVKSKLAKIYPLYFVSFLIAVLLGAIGLQKWTISGNTTAAVFNLLMMQPWFPNLQTSFNGVSWFVADLMLCYLFTPLLSWCIRHREFAKNASTLRSYIVPLVALFFLRMLLQVAEYKGVVSISNHSFPLSRMLEYGMAFVAGTAILNRGWNINRLSTSRRRCAIDSCVEVVSVLLYTVAIFALNDLWWSRPACSVAGIFLVCSFVCSRGGGISKLLSLKPFEMFSTLQMPFYLLHAMIILVVRCFFNSLGIGNCWSDVVAFIATLMISYLWVSLAGRGRATVSEVR
jgi:peptidoglycan/LPS O-acetylase OafA/YrhL